MTRQFLSTPSARRATIQVGVPIDDKGFLSTPSARRATFWRRSGKLPASYFYPRPPRGGRHFALLSLCGHIRISIHALREEGDKCRRSPTRRWRYFYPRPPRGGRLIGIRGPVLRQDFYPRPPRGGRRFNQNVLRLHKGFLSTPSARRATTVQVDIIPGADISIHALREEGDAAVALSMA